MIAMNIKTHQTIEFTPDVSPQYAVAYGYCEQEGRLSELHDAMRLPQLERDSYFGYLGVMTGSLVVSCGDWRSEVEQYANPTEQDAFYSAELITSNQRQTVLLVGTKKQVKHRLIMESKGNDDLIYSDPVLVMGYVITNLSAYDAVIICTDIEVKAHA